MVLFELFSGQIKVIFFYKIQRDISIRSLLYNTFLKLIERSWIGKKEKSCFLKNLNFKKQYKTLLKSANLTRLDIYTSLKNQNFIFRAY